MTLLESAKNGIVTESMRIVAQDENLEPEAVCRSIAEGHLIIPQNIHRNFHPVGIGKGLTTKINANIGTSMDHLDIEEEMDKLDAAIQAGAHSVMDLSTGGDLRVIRNKILSSSTVMTGSVPIYGVASILASEERNITEMTADMLFDEIELQCSEGIDYITVHCGVTMKAVSLAGSDNRICGIVSRGGSLLAAWMHHHNMENPLLEYYDRLLEIVKRYDVTLSLGDGMRPGALADATDRAQVEELVTLGGLAERARVAGVQVMIEGPGHVPLNQIETNVQMEKEICNGAPFYVLGPLTTDCAPGYDHITGAIGGALAAYHGADFLCYVTPAEHLCLPVVEDVRMGVISSLIAAHSADVAKGIPGAVVRNNEMSRCRKDLNWAGMFDLAIDPLVPRMRKKISENSEDNVCTMCGKLCAINTHNDICVEKK